VICRPNLSVRGICLPENEKAQVRGWTWATRLAETMGQLFPLSKHGEPSA